MTEEVKALLVLLVWVGAITIYLVARSTNDTLFGLRVREEIFEKSPYNLRHAVREALEAIEQEKKDGQAMWDKHIAELAAQVAVVLKEGKE